MAMVSNVGDFGAKNVQNRSKIDPPFNKYYNPTEGVFGPRKENNGLKGPCWII